MKLSAKLFDGMGRNRLLVFTKKESASSIEELRVAPLGAVVTHRV